MVGTPFALTSNGEILASGKIDESGRLPRLDFDELRELTLQLGEDTWKTLNVESESDDTFPDRDMESADGVAEENAEGDRYSGALGTDEETHLPSAFLAKLIDNPEGEE
jgi:type VI secretion system secreted protein VgrG